jgi:hypothetical protein
MVTLTESLEILPMAYSRIGQLNLFAEEGIPTTVVAIEKQGDKLALIPANTRGTQPESGTQGKRQVRWLSVPHLPKNDTVLADSVQNVRSFGSDDQLAAVSSIVNSKMAKLKQEHELTHEWHRVGCINGIVLDADGSTQLLNLFTEYGVAETVVTFVPATVNDIMTKTLTVKRHVEDALSGLPYTRIRALCSPEFFTALVTSSDVKEAYKYFRTNFSLEDQRQGFDFGGIIWEEYNMKIGSLRGIPANTARIVVEGVPGLFQRKNAPADFMETVNTIGKPYYAKMEPLPMDKGMTLHTQSNPLHYCTLPATLIKCTL